MMFYASLTTGLATAGAIVLAFTTQPQQPQRMGPPPDTSPPPDIHASMSTAELSRALDAYVGAKVSADTFSGVVLVAKAGEPIYQQAFGLADREAGTKNTASTRFSIGSINKMFTKVAIMQLVATGKLSLTDTVGQLLPDHPNDAAKVATVDQLLNHRGGIPDFFGPAFNAAPKSQFQSNADYYRFVAPQPLLFAPGTQERYCNGCYIVLGAIVEKVSKLQYETYVAQHVFAPAGMKDTGFFRSDPLPERTAIGYMHPLQDPSGPLGPNTAFHGVAGSAAGGAYSTAADLLAFTKAMHDGKLVDPKLMAPGPPPADGGLRAGPGSGPRGPRRGGMGIGGGAPGLNAMIEADDVWTIVVLANLSPPAAEHVAMAIHRQLSQ